jgi:serine protease Do
MAGNVVGVNTAISSVGQGIGFAVPTSIARDVVDQLKSKGKVSRGFLGITVNEITPDLQEAWGLASDQGAVVQSVTPGMPADQAGIKRGDIITAIDGHDVRTSDEVVRQISAKGPGSKVRLSLLRGGKEMTVTASLGDREEGMGVTRTAGSGSESPKESNETKLGITVEELTPQILQELGLVQDTDGVVVTKVSRVSEAWEKGVGDGDVITEVNRVPVTGLSEYRREIRKVSPGGLVVLYVISPPSRTSDSAISRYVTLRVVKED